MTLKCKIKEINEMATQNEFQVNSSNLSVQIDSEDASSNLQEFSDTEDDF